VQGISFAVSAEVAEPVVAALIADGAVHRGFLGITAQDLSGEAARTRGLPEGAAVAQVTSGSPAARAGILAGDVITAIGDVSVTGVGDITNALTRYPPGSRVPVTVARGSERLTLDVTLGAAG
jgi:S1-C subfamily serine protease